MILQFIVWAFILCSQLTHALIEPNHPALQRDETNVITVTEDNYPFISQGVDGYYNILFLTMRSKRDNNYDCQICIDFEPVYKKVATAVKQQAPRAKVLFYIADVHDVPSLVKDLKLTNVPHVVGYTPPKDGEKFSWAEASFYHYQLSNQSVQDILHFGNFIGKFVQVYIQLEEDFSIVEFISYFSFFIGIFLFFKKVVLPNITNRWKFGMFVLSLFIIFMSITGYKFTEMNSIPLLARDEHGKIMYFSGGSSWQFGIEIFTVSAMYIVMGLCTLLLIWINNWSFLDDGKKSIFSVALALALFSMFNYYLSCYHIKEPGYPY
ncbi:dolichyl-diphosphooligosaccharide--protein glycosyltransferase subunit Ost6p [Monosporozyma unispora]|nr:ER oligosaccharyltransferase complex subunit [Kazachstania unispora]